MADVETGGDRPMLPPDITGFDALANRAALAKTKGAGQGVINDRNAYLRNANEDQRSMIGQKYYAKQFVPNAQALHGSPDDFLNVILGGDQSFLKGLADDTGTPTPPPIGGGNGGDNVGSMIGPGNNNNNSGSGGGGFDQNGYMQSIQQMINTLLSNQQNQFNSTISGMQGSSPTLSVGSVSNSQGDAASRARSRNTNGIVSTLAARRGRRAAPTARRYF